MGRQGATIPGMHLRLLDSSKLFWTLLIQLFGMVRSFPPPMQKDVLRGIDHSPPFARGQPLKHHATLAEDKVPKASECLQRAVCDGDSDRLVDANKRDGPKRVVAFDLAQVDDADLNWPARLVR